MLSSMLSGKPKIAWLAQLAERSSHNPNDSNRASERPSVRSWHWAQLFALSRRTFFLPFTFLPPLFPNHIRYPAQTTYCTSVWYRYRTYNTQRHQKSCVLPSADWLFIPISFEPCIRIYFLERWIHNKILTYYVCGIEIRSRCSREYVLL